jgi:hypothetical protein
MAERRDSSKVMIYNDGRYAPLEQLGYLKLISMFYGKEEEATSIYASIASNYRCVAANVYDRIMATSWPTGAFVSVLENTADGLSVYQNNWWNVLARDAGSRLVNVSSDGTLSSDNSSVSVAANKKDTNFAQQSWAMIDTSYYLYMEEHSEQNVTSPDVQGWLELTGLPSDIYAAEHENIWLTDKATNRNRRHSKSNLIRPLTLTFSRIQTI